MNKPSKKHVRVYLLILILLTSHLGASAQRPPTSGPNPDDDRNLTPYIIAGSTLVLAAGSYFYLRSRGPKIAVGEHLPNYLLSRNILPTTDAINLMYRLNPSLANKDLIRVKRKLVNPDFPEIPNTLLISSANAVQTTTSMPAGLKDQVDGFSSLLNTFRNTAIIIKPIDTTVNLVNVNSILTELEAMIVTPARRNEESNTIKDQLMTDLIRVLNQTLENIIAAKIMVEEDIDLIKDISGNLSDLLFPVITNTLNSEESSHLQLRNPYREENLYLASADKTLVFYPKVDKKESQYVSINASSSANESKRKTMKFAFLVHKYTSTGEPITKGPEVEGRFKIQYAMPALEGRTDTYIEAEGLATYALADLPPAKLLIIVTDITESTEVVPLLVKTVDFKVAFGYTNREKINEQEYIVVPIYLPHD